MRIRMKAYTHQPLRTSRVPDASPQACNQASWETILQKSSAFQTPETERTEVIQGVFEYVGQINKERKDERYYWCDKDSDEYYYFQYNVGDKYFLQSLSGAKNVTIDKTGEVLERFTTDISDSAMDKEPPESLVSSSGGAMDVESEEVTEAPSYLPREEQEEMISEGVLLGGPATVLPQLTEKYHVGKLTTNLAVLVELEVESSSQLESVGVGMPQSTSDDRGYKAGEIRIRQIFIGDKDRPQTQFENQESHTVAWTLLRQGIITLAGNTLSAFLLYLQGAYEELKDFIENEEGKALYNMVQGGKLLETLRSGEAPLDNWQKLSANLLINYLQVYQLSSSATYKRGQAKGHGEATAMANLMEDEELVRIGKDTRPDDEIGKDMAKLLDVQMNRQRLSVDEYAYAVYHWGCMLFQVFPNLMKKKQMKPLESVLSTEVSPSFKEELGIKPDKNFTVKDLLNNKNLVVKRKGELTIPPRVASDPEQFERMTLDQLTTDFTANIILRPKETPFSFTTSFNAKDLEVAYITLSDKDRPKTKFIRDQKSHTVPWTLSREAILVMQGKPFTSLLIFLQESFAHIDLPPSASEKINSIQQEAQKIFQQAKDIYKRLSTESFTLSQFHVGASELVRLYFIAYQMAPSTTYVNPSEAGQALGHGEAGNMQILRTNEYAISNRNVILTPKENIVRAAVNLFDVQLTAGYTETNIKTAFSNLMHKLSYAFPNIMKCYKDEIVGKLGEQDIGGGKLLKNIYST